MELILIGGVEVGAEDGELGFGEGGGLKRIKKKKKKDMWSLSGLKVHSLLASPETIGEETWVNVRETLGVNHSGYR